MSQASLVTRRNFCLFCCAKASYPLHLLAANFYCCGWAFYAFSASNCVITFSLSSSATEEVDMALLSFSLHAQF